MRSALTRLARRRRGRLQSAPFAASVHPAAEAVKPGAPARWRETAVAVGLALAATVPPTVLLTRTETLRLLGQSAAAKALIAALMLAPAAVGGVVVLRGLARLRDELQSRAEREPEYAVARIFLHTVFLAYALGLPVAGDAAAAPPCLAAAVLGLISGWLILLHAALRPAPSAARRYAAIIIDAALLSAFLHFAGAAGVALYPVYLVAIFYAGLRLGVGPLIAAAGAALVGFAAVVAITPFWQHQPALIGGLGAVLAAFPVGMALLLRAISRSRAEAVAANAARDRIVAVIGRGLRGPVEAMRLALPEAVAVGEGPAAAHPVLPAQALLSQIREVVDLAAIEAGDFSPPAEPFDLYALVNDTLAPLRAAAAARGIALVLRVDASVPYRLSGWPQQVAQILNSLVIAGINSQGVAPIRVEIGGLPRPDAIVELRITVRRAPSAAGDADPASAWDEAPDAGMPGLGVAKRLVELMGGRIDPASSPAGDTRWSLTLPLALDVRRRTASFDLAQRPVLLVTEDSQFAGELAEPLNDWNADTRWVGGLSDGLIYIERFETPWCPILIVDGRSRVIAALSFVHRAVQARDEPPLILFVSEPTQIASLHELDDGELAGLLAAPLDEQRLENALHALPPHLPQPVVPPVAWPAVAPPEAQTVVEPKAVGEPDDDDRVTPIAAHPRFAAEPASVVDLRVIGALRRLGDGNFLPEVIDSFRADARQLVQRIDAAIAAADVPAFARNVHALRRCAATLGGTRLCELLQSLSRMDAAAELHLQGPSILQRVEAELAGFEAALIDQPPRTGDMRG